MKVFKERECLVCKVAYVPSGPAARYCPTCAKVKAKEVSTNSCNAYRKRAGVKLGVGKGGANKVGKDNPRYTTGVGVYLKAKKTMHTTVRFCNRCGADLLNVHWSKRCVHHIDHNRGNNEPSNFELLCKRCHQLEHEVHLNFNGKP